MSHRPITHKQARKLRKAFTRRPLAAYIDPVQWVLDHGHARSKREARELVLAGRLRSESHPVGVGEGFVKAGHGIFEMVKPGKVVVPVPADVRSTLAVTG